MKPRGVVAVAFSGGRDSTALLHATVAAARGQGLSVVALHVHHGLLPEADAWLAHCAALCRRWAARGAPLSFDAVRLQGRPARGESVEGWARNERYRALAEQARRHGADVVLLAHHRRDQAETWLLQALRGGGVAGLAAMPRAIERQGIVWLRPWLATPADAIEAYARRHRLRWVDDPSNQDARYARSRLRREVWPALSAAFADAEAALASSAQWAQQAAAVLAEVAGDDLARVAGPEGLELAAWRLLTPARRANALRTWCAAAAGASAPATLMQRLMTELARDTPMRWPLAGGELRSYRGRLRFEPSSVVERAGAAAAAAKAAAKVATESATEAATRARTGAAEEAAAVDGRGRAAPVQLAILRAGVYRVPGWDGRLRVRRVATGGVALARLQTLSVVARHGAESFQPAPNRPPRGLKKQFQGRGIAAWERDGPLFYAGELLLLVAGLGVDARALAAPGEPQVSLCWLPG